MSYADSLRQQAKWIREALDPATLPHQRIGLEDVDVEEIEASADEIERLRGQVERQAKVLDWIKANPGTHPRNILTVIDQFSAVTSTECRDDS